MPEALEEAQDYLMDRLEGRGLLDRFNIEIRSETHTPIPLDMDRPSADRTVFRTIQKAGFVVSSIDTGTGSTGSMPDIEDGQIRVFIRPANIEHLNETDQPHPKIRQGGYTL